MEGTFWGYVLIAAMIVLTLCIGGSMVISFRGPKLTDRLLAVSMINTQVMLFMVILSVYLDEPYLVDIATIYAVLGFLATVIFAKVFIGVTKEQDIKIQKLEEKESELLKAEGGREENK